MIRTIARKTATNATIVGALAAIVLGGMASQDENRAPRPMVLNANTLIAEHGCTGQDDPTHAVVTVGGVTRYAGQRMTDRAIEQAVFGVDHGMVVHAFCE